MVKPFGWLLHKLHYGYHNQTCFFINIFQTHYFSALKLYMCYEKNMSFLVIPKVGKNEKIGLGSFKCFYPWFLHRSKKCLAFSSSCLCFSLVTALLAKLSAILTTTSAVKLLWISSTNHTFRFMENCSLIQVCIQ